MRTRTEALVVPTSCSSGHCQSPRPGVRRESSSNPGDTHPSWEAMSYFLFTKSFFFFHYKNENDKTSYLIIVIWGFNKVMRVKCLAQCQVEFFVV